MTSPNNKIKALVKGELLIWARKSAGLSEGEASIETGVSEHDLRQWEADQGKPTISQLRELARVYKRPLAVFYLPSSPKDFDAMRDFRSRVDHEKRRLKPEALLQIRIAQERRLIALDLHKSLEETELQFSIGKLQIQDPERLGLELRRLLKIRIDAQVKWKKPYGPFTAWKEAIESKNVLVFQAVDVPAEDLEGFSIYHSELPIISVNIKSPVNARIFTLLHELTHLVIHQTGLCNDLQHERNKAPNERKIETFCNLVAGATLVPKEFLLNEKLVIENKGRHDWEDTAIHKLALHFGVSREVVLRRLLICNRTTKAFYEDKLGQYTEEFKAFKAKEKAKKNKFGLLPGPKVIASAGTPFVKMVLGNYYRGSITLNSVSDILGIKLKHLPGVEAKVMGKPLAKDIAS
ncbi:MAG: XRE family transcriptional regulator [Nitrospirota bacterium]|nr:XRE family transcriptional regulator [Nitrospirota bacterium]